ncbi:acyltransferase domain-containing protein [Micromonospora sp. NPDC048830]|uniref:acyltransferase domain-containing protein n=1 Tax=Micromonospora sp. NPDC048830 TaxID=3364257 RepID=UPI003716E012
MTQTPRTIVRPASPRAVTSGAGRSRLVFLLPGRAAARPGMGRAAYHAEPVVRAEVDAALAALDGPLADGTREVLLGPATGDVPAGLADPALFVLEYALTRLLADRGLTPDAVLGYGVGEVTAACVAGVLDPADALRLVAAHGRLHADLPPTATLAVGLPYADVAAQLAPEVRLVALDTPESCVVAGPEPELRRLERTLAQLYVTCHRPAAPVAAHPDQVTPRLGEVAAALAGAALRPPAIRWLSTVSGRPVSADEAGDPDHWLRQLRQPVRFAEAARQLAGDDRLVEVGPGATLAALLRQTTPGVPVLPALPDGPDGDGPATVLAALPDGHDAPAAAPGRDRPDPTNDTRAGTPRPGRSD